MLQWRYWLMENIIKQEYKKWANAYDDFETNIAIILEKDLLIKEINPQKREIILDAGCGTGRYIGELRKRCKKVIGVDFSPEMLSIAKKKYPDIVFYEKDLMKKLPFKNNSFHKIVSSLVFSHFKDINRTLKELHRVLKKGGKLFITDFPWHATLDWKSIRFKKKKNFLLDIHKTSTFRPIADLIDKASIIGFKNKGVIPLRITSRAEKYLTKRAYEKNKGSYF
mgnify:CR=1 FL=1